MLYVTNVNTHFAPFRIFLTILEKFYSDKYCSFSLKNIVIFCSLLRLKNFLMNKNFKNLYLQKELFEIHPNM